MLVFPHLFFFGLVCVEVNLTFGHCEIWPGTLKLPLEILLNQKRKLVSNYRKLKRAHNNNAVSVLTDIMICPSIHIYSWKHISSVLRHWLMQKLAWWSHRKLTSVAHELMSVSGFIWEDVSEETVCPPSFWWTVTAALHCLPLNRSP